jgi:hypothetical protein
MQHLRGVRKAVARRAFVGRWVLVALACAATLGGLYLVASPERTALRGPAGDPTRVPPLQVRPAPTLDPAPPDWRMPEEEPLPERLRRREPLEPERLARRATPRGEASPALIPPQRLAPEPAPAAPREMAEPLRVARLELPAAPRDLLGGEPPGIAPAASGAFTLAAGPAFGGSPDPGTRPDAGGVPTRARPHPGSPAPARSPEDVLLAPPDAAPLGVLNGGTPVPLPDPPSEKGPSILLPNGKPVETPPVLHVPVGHGGAPGPEIAPSSPTQASPTQAPDPPGDPNVVWKVDQPLPDRVYDALGGRTPPGIQPRAVPEPGTLPLLAAGLLLLTRRRRGR